MTSHMTRASMKSMIGAAFAFALMPGALALPSGLAGSLMPKADIHLVADNPAVPAGFPNASSTGVPAGVTLKRSGGIAITKPGTIVDGLDIAGSVSIEAPNTTLRNCKVTASGYVVVNIKPGVTGVTIENCEINGVGTNNDGSNGINGQGTFLRNNIYNVENGISLSGGDSLIQDNYIHDLMASGAPHYDGIQMDGGQSNVVIRHNTIINDHEQTSAIMIDNYFGPISNISVENNFLAGGGYTVYSDARFKGGTITDVSFTGNALGKGRWGYYSFSANTPRVSGSIEGAPLAR